MSSGVWCVCAGMTKAVLPIMKKYNIAAITVGVNPMTSPPAVPRNPFIWKMNSEDSDEEGIIAFWHPGDQCRELVLLSNTLVKVMTALIVILSNTQVKVMTAMIVILLKPKYTHPGGDCSDCHSVKYTLPGGDCSDCHSVKYTCQGDDCSDCHSVKT